MPFICRKEQCRRRTASVDNDGDNSDSDCRLRTRTVMFLYTVTETGKGPSAVCSLQSNSLATIASSIVYTGLLQHCNIQRKLSPISLQARILYLYQLCKLVCRDSKMSVESAQKLSSLFAENNDLWLDASENHAFLKGCANGTVSTKQFDTWLVQDYMYVTSFHNFLDGIIKSAPEVDNEILNAGMVALNNELTWFRERAKDRGLDLDVAALPTTIKYKDFMKTMAPADYSTQIIALYLIERVYQQAWSVVLERGGKDGMYSLFAVNWGNKEFGQYVDQLETIAERESTGNKVDPAYLQTLFKEIMSLEIMFWDMAFEADSP